MCTFHSPDELHNGVVKMGIAVRWRSIVVVAGPHGRGIARGGRRGHQEIQPFVGVVGVDDVFQFGYGFATGPDGAGTTSVGLAGIPGEQARMRIPVGLCMWHHENILATIQLTWQGPVVSRSGDFSLNEVLLSYLTVLLVQGPSYGMVQHPGDGGCKISRGGEAHHALGLPIGDGCVHTGSSLAGGDDEGPSFEITAAVIEIGFSPRFALFNGPKDRHVMVVKQIPNKSVGLQAVIDRLGFHTHVYDVRTSRNQGVGGRWR